MVKTLNKNSEVLAARWYPITNSDSIFINSQADVVHSVLGVIITFLVCVQPIMALMRPGPAAEK